MPSGTAQTDLAARVFDRFRDLYGVFSRSVRHRAQQVEDVVNKRRNLKVFDVGEIVYRKKPAFARPPKQLMIDPVTGPYTVAGQRTTSSVMLQDRETGELVDGGANIPVEQILAGPRRAPVHFPEESDLRSVGAMIRGDGVGSAQGRPGKRAGWGRLATGAYVAYQTVPPRPEGEESYHREGDYER